MLTLLHLSDLHFTTADAGSQFDRDVKVREALLADLGVEGRTQFAAILVTGDIAYHGRTEEFTRADGWFDEVCAKSATPIDALFVIPGNHDVDQAYVAKQSAMWDAHQALRNERDAEARLAGLEKKLKDTFDFLSTLGAYREFAARHGSNTSAQQLAWMHVLEHGLEDGTQVRLHGLNSSFLSDEADARANLLVSEFQFQHLRPDSGYVDIVLCHHPSGWLLDAREIEDHLIREAHLVLCGHDHTPRCYPVGTSLRLFAGAVHPNRREKEWLPCYHVIRIGVETEPDRVLVTTVETRVLDSVHGVFKRHSHSDREPIYSYRQPLAAPATPVPRNSSSRENADDVSSAESRTPMASETIAILKRKLVIHFFKLGTLPRHEVAIQADVWSEADDQLSGQERWARVFKRAEDEHKMAALWDAVAARDHSLPQANPFNHPSN